jgi:DNA-binding NarL/FixJ family response regulator
MNAPVCRARGSVRASCRFPLNLSQRERELVSLTVQGLNDREIAASMTITKQEVKEHLQTIFDKLGVSDRLELVFFILGSPVEALPDKRTVAPQRRERGSIQEFCSIERQ